MCRSAAETAEPILMFGGRSGGNILEDVWEYWPGNASWRDVTPSVPGPGPRWRHTMVWSETEDGCLVFGGANSRDVWLLQKNASGYQWSEVVAVNPSLVAANVREHTAVRTTIDGEDAMLVYGGIGVAVPKQRLFAFFPHNGTWTTRASGPGSNSFVRYGHTAVWAAEINLMLVFAGRITAADNELHAYNPAADTWQQLFPAGDRPQRRSQHVAVWTGNSMIVASGKNEDTSRGDDNGAWIWRPVPDINGTWERTLTAIDPGMIQNGQEGDAVWDPVASRMYYGFQEESTDFWWSFQLPTTAPSAEVSLAVRGMARSEAQEIRPRRRLWKRSKWRGYYSRRYSDKSRTSQTTSTTEPPVTASTSTTTTEFFNESEPRLTEMIVQPVFDIAVNESNLETVLEKLANGTFQEIIEQAFRDRGANLSEVVDIKVTLGSVTFSSDATNSTNESSLFQMQASSNFFGADIITVAYNTAMLVRSEGIAATVLRYGGTSGALDWLESLISLVDPGLAEVFVRTQAFYEVWSLVLRQTRPYTFESRTRKLNIDNPRADNYANTCVEDCFRNFRVDWEDGYRFKLKYPRNGKEVVWRQKKVPYRWRAWMSRAFWFDLILGEDDITTFGGLRQTDGYPRDRPVFYGIDRDGRFYHAGTVVSGPIPAGINEFVDQVELWILDPRGKGGLPGPPPPPPPAPPPPPPPVSQYWTQLDPGFRRPTPRHSAAMCRPDTDWEAETVLYGGRNGGGSGGVLADALVSGSGYNSWGFAGSHAGTGAGTDSPQIDDGPGQREGHAMTWDPSTQWCVMHGGRRESSQWSGYYLYWNLNDLFEYKERASDRAVEWQGWYKYLRSLELAFSSYSPAPMFRAFHTITAVVDTRVAVGAALFVFGGDKVDDTMWYWDSWMRLWFRRGRHPQAARYGHTCVWAKKYSALLVYGGQGSDNQKLDDLWKYLPNGDRFEAVHPANSAPAMSMHVAVWTGTKMLVTGDRDQPARAVWHWIPTGSTGFPGRWAMHVDEGTVGAPYGYNGDLGMGRGSAVWDGKRQQMIFGFRNARGTKADLWAYSPPEL